MTKERFFGAVRPVLGGLSLAAAMLVVPLPVQARADLPCSDTMRKYCGDVVPGGGRLLACLNDHQDDQSIACKDWIGEQQKSLRGLQLACRLEIAGMCSTEASDPIRMFHCLDYNYVGLKLECREKLREIKERLQ